MGSSKESRDKEMMKLFDFQCKDPNCGNTFEDLVTDTDPSPICTKCFAPTDKILICNNNTVEHNPAQREIMSKSVHIRKRLQKKLPWRKSSYSQSGNE